MHRSGIMFQKQLESLSLPPIHRSGGKEYYLDPIRERLILKTPEETIRQRVLQYLLSVVKVPKEMIQVEMLLSKYQLQSIRRADIIIEQILPDNKTLSPLAVIECKAPEIMIGDSAINQVIDYANLLEADYVFVTNGNDLISAKYDGEKDCYIDIEGIPVYDEMLQGSYIPIQISKPKDRFSYDELIKNQDYYLGYEFNPDTPRQYLPFLTNLWECFLDTTHTMPCQKYQIFTLEQDYGIRFLSCGNASGGGYDGAYRSFIINYKGNTKFINLAFFDYGTSTILTVSTDQENNKPHNSLQYSIKSNLIKQGESYRFVHSGRIAVGNIGSGKAVDLKQKLSCQYPAIINDNTIDLGTINNNKLLYMDDPQIVRFVENLLSYALLRDEYREELKKQKQICKTE